MRVTFLAVRPNAGLVAAGYMQQDYGGIRVWKIGDYEEDWLLEGHTNEVTALDLAADGRSIVSGSMDGSVRVWDLSASKTSYEFTLNSIPIFISRLSSGKLLIVTEDGQFVLLDQNINSLEWTVKNLWGRKSSMVSMPFFQNIQNSVRLACSPYEDRSVTSTEDGRLQVCNLATGARIAACDCDRRIMNGASRVLGPYLDLAGVIVIAVNTSTGYRAAQVLLYLIRSNRKFAAIRENFASGWISRRRASSAGTSAVLHDHAAFDSLGCLCWP
jgi:WD40 repeat protein